MPVAISRGHIESNHKDVVEALKELGLNAYQAKVYLTLLQCNPATGYEISKASGVPQARVYDTLKSLQERNIVIPIDGKPVTYLPMKPSELFEAWERSFKRSLDYLKTSIPDLTGETIEPIRILRDEETIFKYARDIIRHAKHTIYLELCSQESAMLYDDLKAAAQRGVNIKIVGYYGLQLDFCQVYQHHTTHAPDSEEFGDRWLLLSADNEEGMAVIPLGTPISQAVHTRNPGIVRLIELLVIHDIYLLDIEARFPDVLESAYGKNLQRLRDQFLKASHFSQPL